VEGTPVVIEVIEDVEPAAINSTKLAAQAIFIHQSTHYMRGKSRLHIQSMFHQTHRHAMTDNVPKVAHIFWSLTAPGVVGQQFEPNCQ
jgi:hypothetical protein